MTPGVKGMAISVGGDVGGLVGFMVAARSVAGGSAPKDMRDLISGGGVIIAGTIAGSVGGTLLTAKLVGAPLGPAIGVQLVSNLAGFGGSAIAGWPGMLAADTAAAYFAGKAWL